MSRPYGRHSATAALVALACAAGFCAGAPVAGAETVPASVKACAQETDSLKRLICFDKEVARYSAQPAAGAPAHAEPAPAASAKSAPVAAGAAATTAATAAAAAGSTVAPGPAPRVEGASGTQAAAAPADAPPPAPGKPRHIAAKVVSIEPFPDAIVVHLDNNQVWEQVQEASADVNLHAGDTVSIDRELGSYWMSGSNGTAIKVKQRTVRKN